MAGLVEHLLDTRTPMEMAKELAATARDNALLRERVARLECELFWLKAVPAAPLPPSLQQALDTIDAARLRRLEREMAEHRHQGADRRGATGPSK